MMTMASLQKGLMPAIRQSTPLSSRALSATSTAAGMRSLAARNLNNFSPTTTSTTTTKTTTRGFSQSPGHGASNPSILGISGPGGPAMAPSYFQKPSLPANTIVRFVPQQTAWIVERMGKYDRILEPGLAFLIPFLDRIAYVKSLKEIAIEIPSQSAITADNVTLELDGVLYTRVFDAYKARYVFKRRIKRLASLPE